MSWLVKIKIGYGLAAKLKLRDNYAWHQALWEAFPGREGENRSFLFRIDTHDEGSDVLLLSTVEPNKPAWCPESSWAIRVISPAFFDHQYYRFDVRVNATRKVAKLNPSGQHTKNGRRAVISSETDLKAWLTRKAEQSGFQVLTEPPLIIDPRVDYHFRKENSPGIHVGVRFRGVMQVIDQARFEHTFHHGIGSAKAFGFGLLLLQPVYPSG